MNKMHTWFCCRYLKTTENLGDLGIDGKIILKSILKR